MTGTITGSQTAWVLAPGTPYQGGVVAYIFKSGDPGYVAGQCHGLIAATSDQSSGIVWALLAYQTTAVGGTGTALGTGSANTTAIVGQNARGVAMRPVWRGPTTAAATPTGTCPARTS